MRLLRSHGMTTLTWDRHRGHASGYDVVELGFNYRIDEPRAALATRRLARLDAENARRDRLVARYARGARSRCRASRWRSRPREPRTRLAHHLFAIVLDDGVDREAFRAAHARARRADERPLPAGAPVLDLRRRAPELPLTDAYGARAVTLPLFAHMTDEQLELVVDAVRAALAEPAARL